MNCTIEYDLDRSSGFGVVQFLMRGSSLFVLFLGRTAAGDDWSGEVGSVTAAECLIAADALKAWMRKPTYHPHGGRLPCALELEVTNYGKVQRTMDDDDTLYGDPYPEVETLNIRVDTDKNADILRDLFLEMHRRLRGFQ